MSVCANLSAKITFLIRHNISAINERATTIGLCFRTKNNAIIKIYNVNWGANVHSEPFTVDMKLFSNTPGISHWIGYNARFLQI